MAHSSIASSSAVLLLLVTGCGHPNGGASLQSETHGGPSSPQLSDEEALSALAALVDEFQRMDRLEISVMRANRTNPAAGDFERVGTFTCDDRRVGQQLASALRLEWPPPTLYDKPHRRVPRVLGARITLIRNGVGPRRLRLLDGRLVFFNSEKYALNLNSSTVAETVERLADEWVEAHPEARSVHEHIGVRLDPQRIGLLGIDWQNSTARDGQGDK